MVAGTLSAEHGRNRGLGNEQEVDLIVADPVTARMYADRGPDNNLIAHALRADGFDASEDGTGRGTPIVPVLAFANTAGETALSTDEHSSPPVTGSKGNPPMLAFNAKDYGADAGEIAPTLRAGNEIDGNANGGVMPAIAFNAGAGAKARSMAESEELSPTMMANGNASTTPSVAIGGYAARRLTPRECERLQKFPDDYTLVPYPQRSHRKNCASRTKPDELGDDTPDCDCDGPIRIKPAADGPRYKALGNSMCVGVMQWIGERIDLVERLVAEMSA